MLRRIVYMEKNTSFALDQVQKIVVKVAWPQLEVDFDNGTDIRVFIAGDDTSVPQMQVGLMNEVFSIEQPQYGLWKNYRIGSWMQIMLKVPKSYAHAVHISTVSGDCIVRGFAGDTLDINTVNGKLIVNQVQSNTLMLDSVNGSLTARDIVCDTLKSKTVNGAFVYENMQAKRVRASAVSAAQQYELVEGFESLDITSVSGNIDILQPHANLDVKVHAIAANVFYDDINLSEEGIPVRINVITGSVKIKKK